jgi:hypothetical protein
MHLRDTVQRSIEAWLSLVDDERYDASYDAAAPSFRATVTLAQWSAKTTELRSILGRRTLRRSKASSVGGSAPNALAEHAEFDFDTSFEKKPTALERVEANRENDGAWHVARYAVATREPDGTWHWH